MRRKAFCEKNHWRSGNQVYSSDLKRLSHEALSVLQENKTAVWRKDRTENQKKKTKTTTEMGLFHCLFMLMRMIPCLREMSLLHLWLFSMLLISLPRNSHSRSLAAAVWDGNLSAGRCYPRVTWAEGMGGLGPLNVRARCIFREHNVCYEHASLRNR